jgi:single-strand DNA-binding protein
MKDFENGEYRVAYELSGSIKLIQEAKTFESGFTKREMVVIVEDGKYPQEINIEFVQDKVSLLDALQVGQNVTVTFDIRGREYNGRYFNNLQGWKIALVGDEGAATVGESVSSASSFTPDNFDDGDIPF